MTTPLASSPAEAALTYVSAKPDVNYLKLAYDRTVTDLYPYFQQCELSRRERRNEWPGKTTDLRKNGNDAFPWKGASDTEAHVVSERIDTHIAMFMNALRKANIRAYPVGADDIKQSKVISCFLKWMAQTYIPDYYKQMEVAGNYLEEKGLSVTYVGWKKQERTFLVKKTLAEIAQEDPELASAIINGTADDQIINVLRQAYPNMKEKRARKALKALRETGISEIPVSRLQVDRPEVLTLDPEADIFLPFYTMDPQRVPYMFWRTYMTAQEIESKVTAEEWDRDWADYVLSNCRGLTTNASFGPLTPKRDIYDQRVEWRADELYEVVYVYQRLIDKEDGAEGIYCTVIQPEFTGKEGIPGYAKFELINGYEDYPFVFTKMDEDAKRLYDLKTIPQKLRGFQNAVKAETDARIDRNSISTIPETFGPPGLPVPERGPGRHNFESRPGMYRNGDVVPFNQGSVQVEESLLKRADRIMGLDAESPYSAERQAYYVDKFLSHAQNVLRMAYKAYLRFGPDDQMFRVTGSPDAMEISRSEMDENLDIFVMYDALMRDPETLETQLNALLALANADPNGALDRNAIVQYAAYQINPVLADTIIRPQQAAYDDVMADVSEDLAKIYGGIGLNARPSGDQVALQAIQTYLQQPDIAARYAQDEAFRTRIDVYRDGYAFMQAQRQNAVIGRIGATPAAFGTAGQGSATPNTSVAPAAPQTAPSY